MDLIIVRHGQSTGNITTDDVPDGELTPLGRQQAAETAARLAGEGITHVLASPLVRALATGTAIADAAGGSWPAWARQTARHLSAFEDDEGSLAA